MVDIVSPPTNVLTDVVSKFADLQRQVAQAQLDREKAKEELENNSNLKGPSGDVIEYQKSVNKSSSDLKFFSTDIGVLVKDTSRLNVVSNLAEGDKVDFLKFRATGRGDARLGVVGDEGVRVQLMSQTGMVLADSNKSAGSSHEAYNRLLEGKYELRPGEYTLRVTRDPDVTAAKGEGEAEGGLNYALQVRMGDYKQDYDTVAKQPAPGDDPFAPTGSVLELQNMLLTGQSFFSSYQFGQSGTEKLMGSLSGGLINTVV